MNKQQLANSLSDAMKRCEFLSYPEQQDWQLQRLKFLLNRAVKHVPLYQKHYQHCLPLINHIQNFTQIWQIPAISKEDYQQIGAENYIDKRRNLARLVHKTTSGSLGRALDLYTTPLERLIRSRVFFSAWVKRIKPTDRLFCMAAPHVNFKRLSIPNVFITTTMPADKVRQLFLDFNPTVIIGSVEAVALLSRDLKKHNISTSRIRLIFPFGQTLTPFLEAMIRESFSAEIVNLYGATETNWIGYECEAHNGLHIPSSNIVQIAKLNQPDTPAESGEIGEVIVTSLTRWTMPFIRYRLRDVASLDLSPCSCGCHSPRLKKIEGRIQDFLIATTGEWVSPGAIATDLAYRRPNILDHRIVQELQSKVSVWIVPTVNFNQQQEFQHIANVIKHHLGLIEVEIKLVNEIPRDPSGKRRRVYRAFNLV